MSITRLETEFKFLTAIEDSSLLKYDAMSSDFRWNEQASPKCWYLYTNLYGIIFQKAGIFSHKVACNILLYSIISIVLIFPDESDSTNF
jgi:hypothetical protein